jgi:hypothetical protein
MTTQHYDALPPDVAALVRDLHALPTPEPPDALYARIAESRRSGLRVLVPDSPSVNPRTRARRWPWVLLAGCAAGSAFVLWQPSPGVGGRRAMSPAVSTQAAAATPDSAHDQADRALPSGSESTSRESLASLIAPWPQLAYAQGTSSAAPYPPISNIDTRRLRFGERVYLRESANAYHDFLPHDVWRTKLAAVVHRGVPAIRLVWERIDRWLEVDSNFLPEPFDTLWLRASDLRPLRHVRGMADTKDLTTFSDSLVTEQTIIDTAAMAVRRRKLGRPEPKYPLPTGWTTSFRIDKSRPFVNREEVLRLLLRAAPLGPGWKASITVRSDGINNITARDQTQFLNLRVAGLDTLQLFNGRVEAWRVELDTGAEPEVWQVSRATGETLTTRGRYDRNYPRTRTIIVGGLELSEKLPPVRLNH